MKQVDPLREALVKFRAVLLETRKDASECERELYEEAIVGTDEVLAALEHPSGRIEELYAAHRRFITDSMPWGEGIVPAINQLDRAWRRYQKLR